MAKLSIDWTDFHFTITCNFKYFFFFLFFYSHFQRTVQLLFFSLSRTFSKPDYQFSLVTTLFYFTLPFLSFQTPTLPFHTKLFFSRHQIFTLMPGEGGGGSVTVKLL